MQFVRKEKPCYLKQKRYRGQLNALVNSKNLYRCSLDYGYVELCNVVGGFSRECSARQGKIPQRCCGVRKNFVDFRSSRSLNGSFSTESWGYSGICPMMIINKARIVEGLRSKTGYMDKGSV